MRFKEMNKPSLYFKLRFDKSNGMVYINNDWLYKFKCNITIVCIIYKCFDIVTVVNQLPQFGQILIYTLIKKNKFLISILNF